MSLQAEFMSSTSYYDTNYRSVDRGFFTGLGICALLLLGGVGIGAQNGHLFPTLISFLVVLGGTCAASGIQFSIQDLIFAYGMLKQSCYLIQHDVEGRIRYLMNLSHQVRSDGILVLEREAGFTRDPFLALALSMTADARSNEEVRRNLELEMSSSSNRLIRAVQVFETMGQFAPAMGLIGTLLGLMRMMGSLEDPAAIGPAMALALVTTLFGAILSNLFFLPLAGKLRIRLEEEMRLKQVTLEGVVSLGNHENPLILEQKLQAFMATPEAA